MEEKLEYTKTVEQKANLYDYLSFGWISKMFKIGYQKPLQLEDLNYLKKSDHSENLVETFDAFWKIQQNKAVKNPDYKPSVFKAVVNAFGKPIYTAVLLTFVMYILRLFDPLILGAFIDSSEANNQKQLFFYAALLFFVKIVGAVLVNQVFHRSLAVGVRVRGSLLAAIYDKLLRRSVGSRAEHGSGHIMNIITTDCSKLQGAFGWAHTVFVQPFFLVFILYFLYQEIQWSLFVGLGFQIFILSPIQIKVAVRLKNARKQLVKIRDDRLSVVNEVFGAIRAIKMYAWDLQYGEKISGIRKQELRILYKYCLYGALNSIIFMFSTILLNVFTFTAYVLSGHTLTPRKAFVTMAFLNQLRVALMMFPALNVKREQIEYVANDKDNRKQALSVREATFYWDDALKQTALKDINCDFKVGSMTMIIGQTGSGKSALISAIIGCLNKSDEGSIKYYDNISIGYSSQVAWIQNATIKENILFGKEYNEIFYETVVNACGLTPDLRILANGDDTEIGEKGITLSGGQKQRISLARAVYSEADVYIFDDPLSALDVGVANHIFNECFIKLLNKNNKTIILSTHSITFLKYAQNIIVMKDSQIQIQGALKELQTANIDVTQFDVIEKNSKTERQSLRGSLRQSLKGSLRGSLRQSLSLVEPDYFSAAVSMDDEESREKEGNGQLTTAEERGVGSTGIDVYMKYIKAMGGILLVSALLIIKVFEYSFLTINVFWLAKWSASDTNNNWYYIGIWCAITLAAVLVSCLSFIVIIIGRLRASKKLHQGLLYSLLRAKQEFFDETPLGRVINRFSKDMNNIDEQLPGSVTQFITMGGLIVISLIQSIIVIPLFIIFVIPVMVLYYYLQKYFIASMRELRRLSSIMNSPIYSHFGESLDGISIIQTLNRTKQFEKQNKELINRDLHCYYPLMSANRWLSVRLNFISSCLVGGAALSCAITLPPPELVGVALTSVMMLSNLLNFFIQIKAQLEQDIVAVERIDQYKSEHIKQEKAFIVEKEIIGHGTNREWPEKGSIHFKNVWMKYRENLDFVIKGLTFEINGGEKVGVIGRSGAGKSSLFVTLLRMVELSDGKIEIDNVDIGEIGLHDLRKKISVIPQDPVLFNGTIKHNLDPFNQTSDERLVDSLKSVNMWPALNKICTSAENENNEESITMDMDPLQVMVEENGNNFSLGQRQLLCLARAIVRNSKILLLDEATSSVDTKTDKAMQETIRKIFKNNTILTIAHRINTIMDYDKILIVDNGNILEYDSPNNLLNNPQSKFKQIVKESFGE